MRNSSLSVGICYRMFFICERKSAFQVSLLKTEDNKHPKCLIGFCGKSKGVF